MKISSLFSGPTARLLPLSLSLTVVLSGCGGSKNKGTASVPAVPVQIAIAVQQDMPRSIESIGSVQSLRNVAVKSQVDGIIAKIHFQEGDDVKAGDLLVSLDRRPYENSLRIARADLATARAEATRARTEAERYKRLDQQDVVSKEQFAQLLTKEETTQAIVQAKEAAVANAELQFGYTEIRAPISGRTGQLILHEGALVKGNDVNQTIVSINQLSPVGVAYSVPQDALAEIRRAINEQRASVSVTDRAAAVSRTAGRLEFFDNTVDASTGTIVLKAMFDNADHALWPGQFVQVQTQVGLDAAAIVVPSSAVQTGQSGSQVFVMKADQTVELRPVKVLRNTGDQTLIAEGIKAGEVVVTDGQLRLLPGAKAEPKTISGEPIGAKVTVAEGKR